MRLEVLMYALVDCDHFFASCERVFRPELARRPVAVLSNQDGCVIARSPEVKALGVKMGEPLFQCQAKLHEAHAVVFSANFQLYADLSARVMSALKTLSERVEVYSIDEAFLDLSHLSPLERYRVARDAHELILREVGVPVSVGLGETMTLAKLASRFAKRSPERVWLIEGPADRELALRQTALDEVWGIGPRWARALNRQGLSSAWELTLASPQQLAPLNRCGQQTVDELCGQRRFTLQTAPQPRKSARVSRTFGEQVFCEVALCEAMSHFASKLGARLRRHQLTAASLRVWLEAARPSAQRSRAHARPPRARFALSIPLPARTSDSATLIKETLRATRQLYRAWQRERVAAPHELGGWRKGGVLALDLLSREVEPLALHAPPPARVALSELEDQLNRRFGRQTAQLGATPKSQLKRAQGAWRARSAFRSPRYTSAWGELLTINIDRVYAQRALR